MTTFQMVAAVAIGVFSVARLTRLVVFDAFPPTMWIRNQWRALTKEGSWSKLVDCPYCAAPYFAAAVFAWGYFSDYHWTWWVFNGWLAGSYLASIIVAYDGDD